MRLLPSCSEGFRRLAFVACIVTFLSVFGLLVKGYVDDIQAGRDLCAQIHLENESRCNGQSVSDKQACIDKADKGEVVCTKGAARTTAERFETWGIYAVVALVFAYFAALVVRILGWIAAGFGRRTTKA